MEEKLLTFKEAQQYLRVSRSTMFRLLGAGLTGYKVGSTWRFYKEDLRKCVGDSIMRQPVDVYGRDVNEDFNVRALLRVVSSVIPVEGGQQGMIKYNGKMIAVYRRGTSGTWETRLSALEPPKVTCVSGYRPGLGELSLLTHCPILGRWRCSVVLDKAISSDGIHSKAFDVVGIKLASEKKKR